MGQQQLLLIIVGVIVVGVSIAAGINLFAAQAEETNRDAVMNDLIQLSSMARAYYFKPIALGGGGCSFANFSIPESIKQSDNGTIEHTSLDHDPDHIHFEATGTVIGENGVDPIRIEIRMTATEFKMSEKN